MHLNNSLSKFQFLIGLILPVILSHKIRDVIIRPYGLNNASRSGWDIFFGKPDTYKLAPLIASELGRANETY